MLPFGKGDGCDSLRRSQVNPESPKPTQVNLGGLWEGGASLTGQP